MLTFWQVQEIKRHNWESFKELNSTCLFSSSRIIKPANLIISLYQFVDIEPNRKVMKMSLSS